MTRRQWTGGATIVALVLAVMGLGAPAGASPASGSPSAPLSSVVVQDVAPLAPFANGIASDPQGNLYVASCNAGLAEIPVSDPTQAVPFAAGLWSQLQCPDSIAYFAGYLYVADSSTGVIWQISADGLHWTAYYEGVLSPLSIAFGPDGTLYAVDGSSQKITAIAPGGNSATTVNPNLFCPSNVADRSGTLFVDSATLCSEYVGVPPVFAVSSTDGVATPVLTVDQTLSQPVAAGGQIAVDPMGNVFMTVALKTGGAAIVEIPAGTTAPSLVATTGYPLASCPGQYGYQPAGVTWANGYIYFENSCGFLYGGDIARFPDPVGVSSARHLVVQRDWTTLSATWDGVAGAQSYTCTLLYGLGVPSTFTTIVRVPTCSFYGLTPSVDYGVQVVANSSSGSSSPTGAFPQQSSTVIRCADGRASVSVRAWDPRCPAHFHRVG